MVCLGAGSITQWAYALPAELAKASVAELETPHDRVTNSRRTGPQAAQYPEIPWRRVVDLGNQFRHAYHHINPGILWLIYANDLDLLEATLLRMIAAYGPIPERPEDVRRG